MDAGSRLEKPLIAVTRRVIHSRRWVVLASLALAVLSTLVAARWLGFRTSRLDLLNPRSDFNQRWLAYLDEFGDRDDVMVVVAGDSRSAIEAALAELGPAIEARNEYYDGVLYQVDLSQLKAKVLHQVPLADLRRIQEGLRSLDPMLRGDWVAWQSQFLSPPLHVPHESRRLAQRALGEQEAGGVVEEPKSRNRGATSGPPAGASSMASAEAATQMWLEHLRAALSESTGPLPGFAAWNQLTDRLGEFDPRFLLTEDGQMGFIALQFRPRTNALVRGADEINGLRSLIGEYVAQHPEVQIGLTGMPVLEYDEMCSSQNDMTIATLVSLGGVILLLLAGLGSWRYTALAMVILLIGMAWSFGFVTLAVGHLNILSISFAAILIGLGIDFGIHYLVRYVQVRSSGLPLGAALVRTAREIGPGVITGAVTTAFAFFAAGLTDFTGVVELGVIAGAGILICLGAALVVTPAVTYWWDRHWPARRISEPLSLGIVLKPLNAAPGTMALLMVILGGVAIFGIERLRYDHNLLNLQPRRLDSVAWEHRLLEHSDRSVFFAVSMCKDREELLQRKQEFERLPSVERTEEVVTLVPVASKGQRRAIQSISSALGDLPEQAPTLPPISADQVVALLSRLPSAGGMRGAGDRASGAISGATSGADAAIGSASALDMISQQLSQMPPAEIARRLTVYQQRFAVQLLEQLHQLRSIADPEPPSWAELPHGLSQRFVGRNGICLLRVYAKGNIWDMPQMERFVAQVESIDGRVTGHPVQTYYASKQMQRSFIHAAVYALLALMIVLVLDFRNLGHSFLALMPLLLGVWLMLGVLGLLDIPLNAANMIVLPLILGIGIDSGVHVIHDWRSQGSRNYVLSPSVAVAMLLCSSTTMVGFSSMVFAKHQGLRTLGEVLTLGLACCQASSLFFLPGLLMWLGRRAPVKSGSAEVVATSMHHDR